MRKSAALLRALVAGAGRARTSDNDDIVPRLVRSAGVPTRKDGVANLRRLGLLDVLTGHVRRRALYTLDALLEGRNGADEVGPQDVDVLVQGRAHPVELVLRSDVRLCYERLMAAGATARNPSPRVRHTRPPLPPHLVTPMSLLGPRNEPATR